MTAHRAFKRSFDSLPGIVAFTRDAFARQRIDPRLLQVVDLALEEFFTNMVKYSAMSDADVRIDIAGIDGGVEVTLTDYDVDPFDVTEAPDPDIRLPIDERKPGGLGLHLVRRLLDSIAYEYTKETRQSRIIFRKMRAPPAAPEGAFDTEGE